jgi:hypothetical protein
VDTFEIRSEPVYCASLAKNITGVNVVIGDPVIGKFFEDHQKIRDLYISKTIDREMYDAWIEKRLRALGDIPLDILPLDSLPLDSLPLD